MLTWIRRLLTLLLITAVTTGAALWWLHDGDLEQAVEPVLQEWDADGLAKQAGFGGGATEAKDPPAEPQAPVAP